MDSDSRATRFIRRTRKNVTNMETPMTPTPASGLSIGRSAISRFTDSYTRYTADSPITSDWKSPAIPSAFPCP